MPPADLYEIKPKRHFTQTRISDSGNGKTCPFGAFPSSYRNPAREERGIQVTHFPPVNGNSRFSTYTRSRTGDGGAVSSLASPAYPRRDRLNFDTKPLGRGLDNDIGEVTRSSSTRSSVRSRSSAPTTASSSFSSIPSRAGGSSRPSSVTSRLPRPTYTQLRPRFGGRTEFRRFYDRGDLPVSVIHANSNRRQVDWKVDLSLLDYHYYLPIFMDGLREREAPYDFLATQGTFDLLENGGKRIIPTIPQFILPLKDALCTRDIPIVTRVLHVILKLIDSDPYAGQALVPYYRQILPTLNYFKDKNTHTWDEIDFGHGRRIGDLVETTLHQLELTGGHDAFVNIKYIIPSYESVVFY